MLKVLIVILLISGLSFYYFYFHKGAILFISTSQNNYDTYRDGIYTGKVADAIYGNLQVKVTISNGKITDVLFLQYPNDRTTSVKTNERAMPILAQEAIQSQSARVDIVSGATQTSKAFVETMQSALDQAAK